MSKFSNTNPKNMFKITNSTVEKKKAKEPPKKKNKVKENLVDKASARKLYKGDKIKKDLKIIDVNLPGMAGKNGLSKEEKIDLFLAARNTIISWFTGTSPFSNSDVNKLAKLLLEENDLKEANDLVATKMSSSKEIALISLLKQRVDQIYVDMEKKNLQLNKVDNEWIDIISKKVPNPLKYEIDVKQIQSEGPLVNNILKEGQKILTGKEVKEAIEVEKKLVDPEGIKFALEKVVDNNIVLQKINVKDSDIVNNEYEKANSFEKEVDLINSKFPNAFNNMKITKNLLSVKDSKLILKKKFVNNQNKKLTDINFQAVLANDASNKIQGRIDSLATPVDWVDDDFANFESIIKKASNSIGNTDQILDVLKNLNFSKNANQVINLLVALIASLMNRIESLEESQNDFLSIVNAKKQVDIKKDFIKESKLKNLAIQGKYNPVNLNNENNDKMEDVDMNIKNAEPKWLRDFSQFPKLNKWRKMEQEKQMDFLEMKTKWFIKRASFLYNSYFDIKNEWDNDNQFIDIDKEDIPKAINALLYYKDKFPLGFTVREFNEYYKNLGENLIKDAHSAENKAKALLKEFSDRNLVDGFVFFKGKKIFSRGKAFFMLNLEKIFNSIRSNNNLNRLNNNMNNFMGKNRRFRNNRGRNKEFKGRKRMRSENNEIKQEDLLLNEEKNF